MKIEVCEPEKVPEKVLRLKLVKSGDKVNLVACCDEFAEVILAKFEIEEGEFCIVRQYMPKAFTDKYSIRVDRDGFIRY